ncbi:response regulator transcription factor [Streptococcus suis]|uniref:response regulator transcription factor n=1 Tax=Streptococcus suis TaxID=1307 RepID=UPI001ABE6DF1|nr:response regulator transcription factor [Streptococcus suis]MBO4109536.1 response regulator transcription factor [Streptococcus suis]MDG3137139.1 response regulator transcription factor [Streptococcus suis]HEM3636430.1 response regulator transcription factor [Streptococcus suis]HEM3641361.1 response regulator transcription factor [Streptococcus suis]HEM3667725.1 response regulator transcription factor [Streptococcus suis]
MKDRILLIEDDSSIREGVRILLESEGFSVKEAASGEEGIDCLTPDTDLIILDVMMPGMSGLRTCEQIRKVSSVPILFLSAKVQESDKLIGLMVGGDSYLTKPFSYSELLGQVKALIRRYKIYQGLGGVQIEESPFIELGGVKIHKQFNEVFVNDKELDLSEIEYQILLLLMRHPRKIFTTQNIYETVWDEIYFYNCNSTVMVHIRKLRVKLEEDPKNPKWIKTVWGKGYKFEVGE